MGWYRDFDGGKLEPISGGKSPNTTKILILLLIILGLLMAINSGILKF